MKDSLMLRKLFPIKLIEVPFIIALYLITGYLLGDYSQPASSFIAAYAIVVLARWNSWNADGKLILINPLHWLKQRLHKI